MAIKGLTNKLIYIEQNYGEEQSFNFVRWKMGKVMYVSFKDQDQNERCFEFSAYERINNPFEMFLNILDAKRLIIFNKDSSIPKDLIASVEKLKV